MLALPLQVIDNFLIQYNIGQVLLLAFVLGALATLPLRSRKVLSLHVIVFGLLFLVTPQSLLEDLYFKFIGIALLVLGPMLFITARR
ncbi:hypothetical protein BRC83_04725 [Halobacteriales archaeon QS_1_68_17]|nr:MAG: hypothetical protein BRC83_04725 [Halobacteriales archaeon QS_1_68_17]